MSFSLTAPLDELFDEIDKIFQWLDLNRLINEGLRAAFGPLFEKAAWIGAFAEDFMEVAIRCAIKPIKPIIDIIDAFLDALRAVVDTIREIVEWLTNPVGKLFDSIY
jgi:hypothetical protein